MSARSGLLAIPAGRFVWRGLPVIVGASLVAAPAAAAGGTLELVPELELIVPLLVLFALLIAPVNHLLFKPIFRVLDERESQLEGTRTRAARLQEESEEVLQRYEKSVREVREEVEQERRARLEEARNEGVETTSAARTEAEGEVERARREVAGSLDEARNLLRGQSQDLARQIAGRVLGRSF